MTAMTVKLRSIAGTEACTGWAGGHTIVVDRPEGRAGGQGLGFNGGQMLALAIGGCLCNDLYYVAHDMDVRLTSVAVDVTVAFEGSPLLATGADVQVTVMAEDPSVDVRAVIERAQAISTVANSVTRGIPVRVLAGSGALSATASSQ
jgi:organic hydroperoxide reductase OsmC/OhrA